MEITNYQDENLKHLLEKLIPEFNPTAVYLFGSRAKGTHSEGSDYDIFMVVKDSDLEPRERVFKARKMLWNTAGAIDLFIYTEKEFNDWKNEFSSIPHTAFTEGLKLEFV